MADSTLIAIKGIVAKLKAEAGLIAIITPSPDTTGQKGIYTEIPQQSSFPYCLVEIESKPWAQDDASSMQHKITVHGYSRKNSMQEAANIAIQAYNALDRQEAGISIDSGNILECVFDGVKTTFKEPDGITWHSVIEFRFIIN